MTAHTHRTHVEGCYRCELSRDEMTTADALTEVADYHVTECVDMHGDQGEDGPGPDCCFHARAAYTVGDAARLLRTPDTPTDSECPTCGGANPSQILDACEGNVNGYHYADGKQHSGPPGHWWKPPTDSDTAARLPAKCPTCGSENPTTYYGSCFDNQHSTIFDPRLPLDPWHAYMTDLRLLRRDVDNLNAYVEAGREVRERVEAERDAAVARADEWRAECDLMIANANNLRAERDRLKEFLAATQLRLLEVSEVRHRRRTPVTDTDHDELRTLADKLDDIAQRAEVEHISGVRPALRKWDTDRLRVAAAVLRDDLRRRQRAYLATQRLTAERDAAVARADALTAAIDPRFRDCWTPRTTGATGDVSELGEAPCGDCPGCRLDDALDRGTDR